MAAVVLFIAFAWIFFFFCRLKLLVSETLVPYGANIWGKIFLEPKTLGNTASYRLLVEIHRTRQPREG